MHYLYSDATLLIRRLASLRDAIVLHPKVVLLEKLLCMRADLNESARGHLRVTPKRRTYDCGDLPPVLSKLLQSL